MSAETPVVVDFAEKLGIQVIALQVGAAGTRVDLRYRVVDSLRAAQLTNWHYKACLIDSSGRRIVSAGSGTGAPLRRESGQLLKPGRIYSHFFPNPVQGLKPGDKVTLVIGDLSARDLLVR
ncbi:MAG TPA: hypothetical protein VEC99_18040 [Clostridia bacterium]|nr:hypothetical protein [Clostridia bacterium]